jgi:hypothetical protein
VKTGRLLRAESSTEVLLLLAAGSDLHSRKVMFTADLLGFCGQCPTNGGYKPRGGCPIPTLGNAMEWVGLLIAHELKHDGYRLQKPRKLTGVSCY